MGTIISRKRRDGTMGHTAQIVIKQKGKIVHREAKTFDRRQGAAIWLDKREAELKSPGGVEAAGQARKTLADAIDHYIRQTASIGRTKTQVLRTIKGLDIGGMPCGEIGSKDVVAFAEALGRSVKPQTVGNYLSHLGAVFAIAGPAWGYALDHQAIKDATRVLKRMGAASKSDKRDRRPTLDELDKLMAHFIERQERRPDSAPMHKLIAYAIFSTRRQDEIVRPTWANLDEANKRLLVKDMKHPGQKRGNDVWVDLPAEALAIIKTMMVKPDAPIFPYTADAISAAFTRACQFLKIEDLHFHDLRHDGVSRLFEMGWDIPHVALVSGHRSWSSLQRYSHIRQAGDKYKDWKWLKLVTN
jgi:integrase